MTPSISGSRAKNPGNTQIFSRVPEIRSHRFVGNVVLPGVTSQARAVEILLCIPSVRICKGLSSSSGLWMYCSLSYKLGLEGTCRGESSSTSRRHSAGRRRFRCLQRAEMWVDVRQIEPVWEVFAVIQAELPSQDPQLMTVERMIGTVLSFSNRSVRMQCASKNWTDGSHSRIRRCSPRSLQVGLFQLTT